VKRDIVAAIVGMLAVVGATLFSIAGDPVGGSRQRPAPAPSGPSAYQRRVAETPPEPPIFADLLEWLRIGAAGKRWSAYEAALDDGRLRIVTHVGDASPIEELRDSCLNITSLVHLWDPLFQVQGEIVQLGADSRELLASCTLRDPIPGGRPSGGMTDSEAARGPDSCWTVRCSA
jgi:hypothetical protein